MDPHTYDGHTWHAWLDIANGYEAVQAYADADAATQVAQDLLILDTPPASSTKTPEQAMQELRALASQYFDGVDAEAYVSSLRRDEEQG